MLNFEVCQHCIATCLKCAAICNYCVTSCLQDEDASKFSRLIQLSRECSYIANVTAQVLSLRGESMIEVCELTARICKSCSDEAAKYDTEFCRLVDDICRRTIIECKGVGMKHARQSGVLQQAV